MSDRAHKTGIKVVVVGAGFGGLTTAIECLKQGHEVVILDQFSELKPLGDIISFGTNAGHIFHGWDNGKISEKINSVCVHLKEFKMHKFDGDLLYSQAIPPSDPAWPNLNGHRGDIHTIVWDYLHSLGIKVRLNSKVVSYYENESLAGVQLESGEKIEGDLVIGADGVRSKARELVLGFTDAPKASGYAIFRSWFNANPIRDDPRTNHLVKDGDSFNGWIGPDVHMLVTSIKDGQEFCWVLTHKDDRDIEESWMLQGRRDDALKVVADYDPVCKAIVENTPEKNLVDWKLVYRDPLPRFVSDGGRTILLGDASHPMLPTSIQGASQSMEDGVAIAICLKRAGKNNVPLALRTSERLRYERVHKVQKTGEATRDKWHKITDWDAIKKNPEKIMLPRDAWILNFDIAEDTEARYNAAAKEVQAGLPLHD